MIPMASIDATLTRPLMAAGSWGWAFWIRNSSTTVEAAVSRPARMAASTSATIPPIMMRYLPRGTMVVMSSSTSALFIMASVASIPLAMELVSRKPMAGPRDESVSGMGVRLLPAGFVDNSSARPMPLAKREPLEQHHVAVSLTDGREDGSAIGGPGHAPGDERDAAAEVG